MSGGLAQINPVKTQDHYDLDEGDATHPIYVPYIVPGDVAGIIRVTLSWLRMPFRSTTNINPSSIGTDATASSGHSHNHGHGLHVAFLGAAGGVWGIEPVLQNSLVSGLGPLDMTGAINANAQAESGHSHSHAHTLSGTGVQSVTDGPTATVLAVSIDGVDQTSALGGPWTGDMVELDISAVFAKSSGRWHKIALSLSDLGRLVSLLRIYHTT